MPNYKLIHSNKWISKKAPRLLGYGHGWCRELSNIDSSDIPWNEKQRIKNELFGENTTAIEIFPTNKNLVDEANMYHLWVLPDKFILPFGLHKG